METCEPVNGSVNAMVSNSQQTKRIRERKRAKSAKKRKRLLRRQGSTPSLSELLKE
jgi:hypothetical protein